MTYPKIELHVHLEGTVRPETLLEIARRNDYKLPVDSVEGVRALYEYRDFAQFIEIFMLTSAALERENDFRQITVEYAEEAARHGAVYLEAIFALGLWRGLDSDIVFSGVCDGAAEARDRFGIEIRLTPDIARVYSLDEALHTNELAERFDLLLEGLGHDRTQGRLIAAGGLSRSNSWIRFLESRHNQTYERAPHEHSSLIGIARVIERKAVESTTRHSLQSRMESLKVGKRVADRA